MAATAIHGKAGRVEFNTGAIASVVSWSINATCGTTDATAMSSVALTAATHWKTALVGFKNWTATVECLFDDGGLDPDLTTDIADADGAALVLYTSIAATAGRMYTGNAIVTNISPTADAHGNITVTYSFQGSDSLADAESNYTPA